MIRPEVRLLRGRGRGRLGGGADAPGGPWVAWARAGGVGHLILTSSRRTPSTACTAARAWRTRVAGSSGASRKVKLTSPSSVTVRSRIMPAERRSFSSRGFRMRGERRDDPRLERLGH